MKYKKKRQESQAQGPAILYPISESILHLPDLSQEPRRGGAFWESRSCLNRGLVRAHEGVSGELLGYGRGHGVLAFAESF